MFFQHDAALNLVRVCWYFSRARKWINNVNIVIPVYFQTLANVTWQACIDIKYNKYFPMKRVSEKWKAHRGVLHLSIMKLKLFKGTALECTNVSSVGRERGWTTLQNAVTCWWKRAMFFYISPPPPQITKSIAFREKIKHNNNVKPLDYIHEGEFFLHLSWMESPCMNH